MEEKKIRKPLAYPIKLLQALEDIYSDPSATMDERLRAIELSLQVLPHRTIPKRSTAKERAVIAALNKVKKPDGFPAP